MEQLNNVRRDIIFCINKPSCKLGRFSLVLSLSCTLSEVKQRIIKRAAVGTIIIIIFK